MIQLGKDPFKSNYKLLINGREKEGIKTSKNRKHLLIIHKQLMMFMRNWKTLIRERKGEC